MRATQLLFKCSMAIGALLSVLLVVETVVRYRYVEGDLVREEAQRESDRRVRSIARAARLMRVEQFSEMGSLLREVAHENPNQIAWIRIIAGDGHIIATSNGGDEGPRYSRDELQGLRERHRTREWKTVSGPVIVVRSPLLLSSADNRPRPPAGGRPDFIEVAMYRHGISINFGPLRHDLIVGLSAAFALLGTVVVVGVRFGDYVRGKQIEKELAAARQVQLGLFPAEHSIATHMEFAARCVPAWEVGGDLYDVFETADGDTAFVLGDVSGRGLSAALLMGLVQGAVRASYTGQVAQRCQHTAEELNRLLYAKTALDRFVTLFCCTFDARSGILGYVNAGHCPPLLIRGGAEVLRLEVGGPVLGMLADARYDYGEVMVEAGDLLVIYSDGIVEAADAHEQEFGEERLISVIERNWRNPPAEICESIVANVNTFIGSQAARDDQTLVIARLEPSEIERIPAADAEPVVKAQINTTWTTPAAAGTRLSIWRAPLAKSAT
jgi:hypothetical protein